MVINLVKKINQLEQLEAAKAARLALICYTLVFTSLQMFCNLQQMLPICRTYLKDIEKVCKGPMNGRTNLIYLLHYKRHLKNSDNYRSG